MKIIFQTNDVLLICLFIKYISNITVFNNDNIKKFLIRMIAEGSCYTVMINLKRNQLL